MVIWKKYVLSSRISLWQLNLRLKETAREGELFNKVQFIAAKLKSARGTIMLTADTEYVALLGKQYGYHRCCCQRH